MSLYTLQGSLASAVANGGTFTVSYPSGTNKGDFLNAVKHGLVMSGVQLAHIDQFLVTPGTSNITITNRSGSTWAADSAYVLGLDLPGERDVRDENGKSPIKRAYSAKVTVVNLGAPITADADGIATAQAIAGAADATLNGVQVVDGVAVLDVPRNITAVSSGAGDTTQTITVTGLDEYGEDVVETIALNGTTPVAGKKAFKSVSEVAVSAALAGNLSVGFGDVLGLPLFVASSGQVIKELQDGASATAGTLVVGVTVAATATSGDVRGTYDPNAACDGSKCFTLFIVSGDPAYYGSSQYAG